MMDEEVFLSLDDYKATLKSRKGLRIVCNLHNVARLVSIALALSCLFVLENVWNEKLALDNIQLFALYVSIFSTFPLLFGTLFSVHALYIPAVYIMRFAMVKIMLYNTYLIVNLSNDVDTFALETVLRTKTESVGFMNKNFNLLNQCFKLTAQLWIFLLIFISLQILIRVDCCKTKKSEEISEVKRSIKQQQAMLDGYKSEMKTFLKLASIDDLNVEDDQFAYIALS